MPKPPLSKEAFLAKRIARAEKEWERRKRNPKVMGRPSHDEADGNAIAAIVTAHAGVSGPKLDPPWTQAEWIKQVGKQKGTAKPGKVTIVKNLKAVLSRNLIPMHLIPAKTIQAMPLQARLDHFFAMAMAEAIISMRQMTGRRKGQISFLKVDAIHRRLCREHLWKKKRLPEAERQAWCKRTWAKTLEANPKKQKPTPARHAKPQV